MEFQSHGEPLLQVQTECKPKQGSTCRQPANEHVADPAVAVTAPLQDLRFTTLLSPMAQIRSQSIITTICTRSVKHARFSNIIDKASRNICHRTEISI